MGQLLVDLLPEMIGLLVTPAAIVGVVLLLQSARPVPNALAFAAGFMTVYVIVSVFAVIGGASSGSGTPNTELKDWVGAAVGALFLVLAIVALARSRRAKGPPKWMSQLESCTPRIAFLAGLGLAVLNPNLFILLSGLSAVGAAGLPIGPSLVGVLALLLFCLLDFALPLGAYLLFGDRARAVLDRTKAWMLAHDTALSVGVLLVFGVVFLVRGVSDLLAT